MVSVTIDRNVNLVIPIYGDDGDTVVAWVHSVPIGREVFDAYYRVIGRVYAAIHGDSIDALGPTAGPKMAALLLRDEARRMGVWEGPAGVENGLVNEIKRLTNVAAPGPKGWETMPYGDAIRLKKIDPDDAGEVDNAIVFFTVGWWVYPKSKRSLALTGAARLWSGHSTSLSVTEFAAGSPTSTPVENTADVQAEIAKTRSSIPT
jgi:hypothetical protein